MTSATLLDYVQTHQILQALSITIEPNEVYRAANFAQAEILRQCELLDEYVQATMTAEQSLYSSSTSGWEFLARTVRVKGGYCGTTNEPLKPASEEWVNEQRHLVTLGRQAKPRPPKFFYHRLTDPVSLYFWGDPETAQVVNLTIVRGHSSTYNISNSVNPLIPAGYEELLTLGTVFKFLDFRKSLETENRKFVQMLSAQKQIFEEAKLDAKLTRSAQQNYDMSTGRMKW